MSKIFYTKKEIEENEKKGEKLFHDALSQEKYPDTRFPNTGVNSNAHKLNETILKSVSNKADYECEKRYAKGTGLFVSCKKGVKKAFQKENQELFEEYAKVSREKDAEFKKYLESRK